MKAQFEDIPSKKGEQSLLCYRLNLSFFPFKWHYHPEYELTLISKGKGRRLVGDNHDHFEDGDLVLLGCNLPHTWVSKKIKGKEVSAVVIQFSKKFIDSFTQYPEFANLNKLLANAVYGLCFRSKYCKEIIQRINDLPDKKGVEQVLGIIHVLHELSTQKQTTLASRSFPFAKGSQNERRINKVCQFIQKNSANKISLSEIAQSIHLTESGLCKFFKRITGKTVSEYINELRIGNACTLLTESDKLISEIAYECGFENLAYFNRIFLKYKKATPRTFRNSTF